MDIKDIALFARVGAPCASQISFAARLAHDHGARISGVCLLAEPDLPICDSYAIGREAVVAVLADRTRAARGSAAPIETALRQAATDQGCAVEWSVVGPDETLEEHAFRARFADLVIVRRPPLGDGDAFNLAATLVLASGTPCLIVPDTARADRAFDRVLVAWNGSRDAKRALDDSLTLLKGASAVELLVVDGETAAETDAASAAALLAHLARHEVHAELHRLRRSHEGVGQGDPERGRNLWRRPAGHGRLWAFAHERSGVRRRDPHGPVAFADPVLMSH